MINIDALFEEFMTEEVKRLQEEKTPDEIEDMIPDLYERFVTSPCAALNGKTPEEYIDALGSADKLMDAFCKSYAENGDVCSLLLDKISSVPECAPLLTDIINKNDDAALTLMAMNLLEESGAEQPLSTYARWVCGANVDEGVAEKAAEILKDNAASEKETLMAYVDKASEDEKEVLADILVCAGKDERTYALLKEIFLSGRNIPLAAGLVGKYGDERAAEFLYPALDDCNYLEYIEIRNAIEELGGVVDDTMRDFSDDEYYKAIKNIT